MQKAIQKIFFLCSILFLVTACGENEETAKEEVLPNADDYIRLKTSQNSHWPQLLNLDITSLDNGLVVNSITQNRGQCKINYENGKVLPYASTLRIYNINQCNQKLNVIDFTIHTNKGNFSYTLN